MMNASFALPRHSTLGVFPNGRLPFLAGNGWTSKRRVSVKTYSELDPNRNESSAVDQNQNPRLKDVVDLEKRKSDPVSESRESESEAAGEKRFSRRGSLIFSLSAIAVSMSARHFLSDPANAFSESLNASSPSGILNADSIKTSRIYDSSVLGFPLLLKDESKAWKKILNAKVVYLGESEGKVDDSKKKLEVELIQKIKFLCDAENKNVTILLPIFPHTMQKRINDFMEYKISEEMLSDIIQEKLSLNMDPTSSSNSMVSILSLLLFCRENSIKILATGVPEELIEEIRMNEKSSALNSLKQAASIFALGGREFSSNDTPNVTPLPNPTTEDKEVPKLPNTSESSPASSIENSISPSTSSEEIPSTNPSNSTAKALQAVKDQVLANSIKIEMSQSAPNTLLIVITDVSGVKFGSRGTGIPARVSGRQKKFSQVVIFLNPEKQNFREEGDIPEADFLWFSPEIICKENCFNRADVARVIGSSGKRKDYLPSDLQNGIDRGIVSPDTLSTFFELESNPILSDLSHRFQGLRERWLADPRFLQRLAIEETISITTTLLAQYQKRGENFWSELEYVITDTTRGAVVDFFTVWFPAPTLTFKSESNPVSDGFLYFPELQAWMRNLPDNAFQRENVGEVWGWKERLGSILIGGLKLSFVGFVSSIGTLSVTNVLVQVRKIFGGGTQVQDQSNLNEKGMSADSHELKPNEISKENPTGGEIKHSPILKTALVYAAFLGTSANLRYQIIAGIVEHWVADHLLASQPLVGSALSFVARTANSYWGTQQWVDLARLTGVQSRKIEKKPELDIKMSTRENNPNNQDVLNHQDVLTDAIEINDQGPVDATANHHEELLLPSSLSSSFPTTTATSNALEVKIVHAKQN